jgi:SAM-dependent methyltransferase
MITVDFRRLSIETGFTILDVGCGTGRHTSRAYQCPEAVAVGVDLNHGDLLEARKRLILHDRLQMGGGGRWGLSAADVADLPFGDNTFDLVICSEVLEHIPDDARVMPEIVRVLKPGCNLVISVPRFWPERLCWALSAEYHQADGGHIRIYKAGELCARLEFYGLKRGAMHFAHSLHTPYWWLKCLVGPHRPDCTAVNLYQRFLTWDIMRQPRITRLLDRLLNPLLGKSVVMYFTKDERCAGGESPSQDGDSRSVPLSAVLEERPDGL